MQQKEAIQDKLRSVNDSLAETEKEKKTAIQADKNELVTPLLDKAKNIESEILLKYNNQFSDRLTDLLTQKQKLEKELDDLKIIESNEMWYPNGTTVWFWDYSGSSYSRDRPLVKTTQEGLVAIYDGTQDLGQIRHWRKPKKGDIIVIRKKKDGSLGVKFDEISNWGNIGYNAKYWCAENDTPETNPANIKEKEENN